MRRPATVTVIAVLLILGAIVGLGGQLIEVLHPTANPSAIEFARKVSRLPLPVATAIGAAVSLVDLVSGILLLRQRVLGRTLYAAVGALVLVESVLTSPSMVWPFLFISVAMYAVFVFLLFRPAVTSWLRSGHD